MSALNQLLTKKGTKEANSFATSKCLVDHFDCPGPKYIHLEFKFKISVMAKFLRYKDFRKIRVPNLYVILYRCKIFCSDILEQKAGLILGKDEGGYAF